MNKEEVLVEKDEEVKEPIIKRVQIDKDTLSVLICVYGTLRRGHGNYRGLLEGRGEYLGTYRSDPKYTMYGRHAGFPVLAPHGSTSIEYEVFKITNSSVLERLHGLEGCTGTPGHRENWYDIAPIKTPHGDAWIYVQDVKRGEDSIIASGNWNDRNGAGA